MSNDEAALNWTREIPQLEVELDDLENDDYGLLLNGDQFTGIAVSHYSNGRMESYRPCMNGTPHGLCRWWHDNGQLSMEWTAYRGMGHGWLTEWYANGQVKKREYAEFGRPIDWIKYDEQGRETGNGTNRGNENTLLWLEKYRREFPEAP
jgi:hypothetical protein